MKFRVCVALVLIGFFLSSESARCQESASVSFQAADWVVHEASGRVFATDTEKGEVVEFNREGEVRRFIIGAKPTEMVIKRDRLIVACTKSPSLHVIDLRSNKVAGNVRLNGRGPYALFCSQLDDNLAFCILNTGSAWWDGEVFQVNLDSLTIRKQVKIQSWGQSHALHVAMSRDGKWIVPDARGASSPSGADLMKVDADELTFTQVRDYHSSFGQMVAGPMNRYWTFGNSLYTLDITKKIRTFKGTPVAIHPQFDLAASLSGDMVVLEKFSDASPIVSVKLTALAKPDPRTRSRSRTSAEAGFDPTLQFDLDKHGVFVGLANGGHWVDLSPFADDLDPIRMINAPSEVKSLVGRKMQVPVTLTNEQASPKAHVVIESGPKTAVIRNGSLIWTPQADDVGFQTIKLAAKTLSTGKEIDSAEVTAHVTLPKIELGFAAKTMSLSPNGKRLAVWGLTPGQESRHPAHTGSDDLAIIDTQTMKVLAKKTLSQGIRDVVIDDKYVVLAPNSGNLFYRINHQLADSKRQFLQSTPKQLLKISPTNIAIMGDRVEVFDLDQMKPAGNSKSQNNNARPSNGPFHIVGQNLVQANYRVTNTASGKLLRITSGNPLPSATNNNGNRRYVPNSGGGAKVWGRRLSGTNLVNHRGSSIAQISSGQMGVISKKWPLAIVIGTQASGRTSSKTMMICELEEGSVQHSSVIDVSPNRGRSPSFYGARNQLIAKDDRVYILNGDHLLVASIPKSIAESMPTPTHFADNQQTAIGVGSKEKFLLEINGDRSSATYALMSEYPGMQLNSKTGEVSVDTPRLWKSFIANASNTQHQFVRPTGRSSTSSLDATENARVYKALLGKDLPPGQLAISLPISATLRDEDGQEDGIDFCVVMTGPRSELDAAFKKQQQLREKQQQEMIARQEQMRKEREVKEAQTPGSPANVSKRLDDLDARMRRIEAALDSILRKIENE